MLETYGKADANGVTKTRVEIYNQWDSKKIEWEVKGAWNSSDFEIIDPIKNIWQGTSPNGIKIKGFINNKTLAYPLYKGDELK